MKMKYQKKKIINHNEDREGEKEDQKNKWNKWKR